MARRQFVCVNGDEWVVYEVLDRQGPRSNRPAHAPRAWLIFESARERRRFSPLPLAWDELPDDELERRLGYATPMSRE